MLTIVTSEKQLYDEDRNEFIYLKGNVYHFEHSLKAIFDWEGIHQKPFLNPIVEHTDEERLDYYKHMCMETLDVKMLSTDNIKQISDYINSSQSATTVSATKSIGSKKILTAEIIYAIMADAGIPFSCEDWNINRLLILLNIISERRNPKKMSQEETYKQNRDINAQRRKNLNSRG